MITGDRAYYHIVTSMFVIIIISMPFRPIVRHGVNLYSYSEKIPNSLESHIFVESYGSWSIQDIYISIPLLV